MGENLRETDLSPHLHTPLCNIYIKHYIKCLEDVSKGSILWVPFDRCGDMRTMVKSCVRKETKARRAEEYEKSPTARKARYLAKKKADEAEEKMRIENNTAS